MNEYKLQVVRKFKDEKGYDRTEELFSTTIREDEANEAIADCMRSLLNRREIPALSVRDKDGNVLLETR